MLLEFKDVYFAYKNSPDILKGVSFNIKNGEKVALLGLNGAGKSTLILHTNGLLQPDKGEVTVNSHSTKSKNSNYIRKTVGIVFQNPDDQLFMTSVWDDVAFGPRNMNLDEEEVNQRVLEALKATKTEDLKDKAPFELSGGQKKSVSLATVLSMSPELLVLDEPTSGMDYKSVRNFIDIIRHLPQALLMSTHDLDLAATLCTRAVVIDDGKIIYDGKIEDAPYPLRP